MILQICHVTQPEFVQLVPEFGIISVLLLNSGESFECEVALLELLNTDTGTLLNDLFQRVPRMDFSSVDIDNNRCSERRSVTDPFYLKIGKDSLFFLRDILETNEIIVC
jgi:hypothetical protein